ncbi:MAG: sulfotransferase family protein, partial [Acidimicrobiales bacterium]
CDKSLSNVFHLDLLADVWPEARFVLLHRHCMDMVLSGLEASPWGLSEYGFPAVAQRSPTDGVVALAAYWSDRTARMLAFERQQPERCLRLRYEDLVADPERSLAGLWAHLGVVAPPAGAAVAELAGHLQSADAGSGPADHTIWYTAGVHAEAVGRGARVPPDHVVGPLRVHVNELLEALGYPLVDDTWGSGASAGPLPDPGVLELRLVDGHTVLARRELPMPPGSDPPTGGVVAVELDALAAVASRRRNLGAALRARQVRWYGPALGDFDRERRLLAPIGRYLAEHADELAAAAPPAGRR